MVSVIERNKDVANVKEHSMNYILVLCLIMQFKHFIADYPLQSKYMLGKFKRQGWVLPLLAHVGVHFVFTFAIALGFSQNALLALLCGVFDASIHFVMDRIKASPDLLGRYESLSKGEFKGLMESLPMCKAGLTYPHVGINEESAIQIKRIEDKFKSNTLFWYSLGLDQLVHHITDILVIAILLKYSRH